MPATMLVAVRLAKEGYGTPEQILNMRADAVLAALEYVSFVGDYEQTAHVLNAPKK